MVLDFAVLKDATDQNVTSTFGKSLSVPHDGPPSPNRSSLMANQSKVALEIFSNGYNCAQAVLVACGGPLGLDRNTALRVAGPFGAGIGRMGGTCGAVSGAFMAIGLKYAKVDSTDNAAKDKGYALAREFVARFEQRHGSTLCRKLLGIDLSTPEGMAQAKKSGVFETRCPEFVRSAVEIVEELLSEADKNHGIQQTVRSKYAAVAESSLSNDHAGVRAVAEAFGYSPEELAAIPKDANMGLSCGNPTAMASLKPGEFVVDLGCGGGLDVFLAAQKVGPKGKAIGIDMTPAMIERAQKNAADGKYRNVEFHLATIDKLPLPDASVDVVISNCVINLAPDKPAVFREIARVLKPGGRLAVSDIALKKNLPAALAQDISAYVGCIAGALLISQYERQLHDAGFAHVQVLDSGSDLNAYAKMENQASCCSPVGDAAPATSSCCGGSKSKESAKKKKGAKSGSDLHDRLTDLLDQYNVNDYAASVKVFAIKP
jgi:C_GCAxxG_C_C family probable redox protein